MKKKIDCMGRELNEKDLVVVSYSGKMELGVVLKNTVRTLSSIEKAVGRKHCYILTNPTKNEKKIKEEIIEKFETYQNMKSKNETKTLKTYGTLIGGIYSSDLGPVYMYLGNLTVIDFDKNKNILRTRSGNCYTTISYTDHPGLDLQKSNYEEVFGEYTHYDFLQFNKGFKQISGLKGIHKKFKNLNYILGTHKLIYNDKTTNTLELGVREIILNK